MKHFEWLLPLSHRNDFHFTSSPRDFAVEEIPLYEFSGEGEHLVLLVRKKDMTTWEMLDVISNHIGIKRRDIGYAGLKDKHAMTMQYVSLPARHEEKLADFAHEKIKILSTTKHNNKIRIGHLKGNKFSLRFKKVLGVQQAKLDSVLDWIEANGVPNYFGHQRFGMYGDNWQEGQAIVRGEKRMRDRKKREFLISAYQSYLFNNWLSRRIEISRLLEGFDESDAERIAGVEQGSMAGTKKQSHFFKILEGDVMMHYPFGRIFYAEDAFEESEKFAVKDRAPTGPILGKRVVRAQGAAMAIEKPFDEVIDESGSRRYAWVFPTDIERKYIPERAHYELEFTLPKGSYATNVVNLLLGRMERGDG
jgi:tRNA pseudouridine13 synthase